MELNSQRVRGLAPEEKEPDTLPQISATALPRDMTESIIPWPTGI